MPRSIQVSLSPALADTLLERIEGDDRVLGLSRQRGASLVPPGDIVTIRTTNDVMRPIFEVLAELRIPPEG